MSAPIYKHSTLSSRPSEARAGTHTVGRLAQANKYHAPICSCSSLPNAAWVPDHVASRYRVSRLSGMTGERMMTPRTLLLALGGLLRCRLGLRRRLLQRGRLGLGAVILELLDHPDYLVIRQDLRAADRQRQVVLPRQRLDLDCQPQRPPD